ALARERDLQDRGARGRSARGEHEVAEAPRDERRTRRPRYRPEHVRMRAEHELRAGVQTRLRERFLPRVGIGMELDAPVEEADGDVCPAKRGVHVALDRADVR